MIVERPTWVDLLVRRSGSVPIGAWETESGVGARGMSCGGFGEVDGGRIHCEGDGDGPAVVMILGGVVWDLRMWDPEGASVGGIDDLGA